MLTLDYCLTEQEYLDFSFYTGWKAPAAKRYRVSYFINNLFLYALLAVVTLYAMSRNKKLPTGVLVIWGGMFIVLLVILIVRIRPRFDNASRKALKSSGDRNLLAPTILTVTDTGISDKSTFSETNYSWNAFVSKVVVNNCYYLFLNTRMALIIPFRVFQGKEKEEFDSLLAKHFPLEAALSDIKNR